MRKNFTFISSIVLTVLLFSMSAMAQSQFGEIEGIITDPAGAVVPNATVTVTGVTVGLNRTATSNSDGFYAFRQLPPGTYNVMVGATSGFSMKEAKNQLVVLETATKVDFNLAVGTTGVSVDVSGGDLVAPVDATESKAQTNISAAKIELLPKGVDFTSLLRTAPGTRGEGLAGGFSVDGASGSENVFIIDGQEVTNFRTGTLNANNAIPTQFVQEVQIKSSGFEAEFGGATGGVINVVTKGGSNDLRGEFGAMFNTSKLNGQPRPTLQRFTNGAGAFFVQRTEYFDAPRAGGLGFFPTANLNGPIIKDKVWYSASYTPQVYTNSVTTDFFTSASSQPLGLGLTATPFVVPAFGVNPSFTINPSAAITGARTRGNQQTYNATTRFEYAFARIDAAPTNNLRLNVTYLWNPIIQDGLIPFGTGAFGNSPASVNFGGNIGVVSGQDLYSRQGGRQNSNNFTAQASYTPSSVAVISGRFSRGFLNEKLTSYFVPTGTRYICQIGGNAAQVAAGACANGTVDPPNTNTLFDASVRTNYEVDATYYTNLGVRQEIKGGYQRFRIKNDVDRGYVNSGRLDFYYNTSISDLSDGSVTASAPICAAGQTTGCVLGSGELIRFGTKGTGQNTNQSIYIQDKIQFGGRVTVNAGIRFEKEDLPAFNELAPPINFGWGDKIAPRLGFAIALNKGGTSKLTGSYGKFYDRLKFELPRGSFGGDFYRIDFFEISPTVGNFRNITPATVRGNFNDAPGGACPQTGFIGSGISRCQFDYRIASNNPNATIFDGKVDPDAKPFQQDEFTLGFQHELSRNYVFTSRFVYKDVKEAIEDAGIRNNTGSEAYIIGNPGSGLHLETLRSLGYTKAATPQRNYRAIDVSLDRRLSSSYYFNVNYTLSRLYGNYSGLASSDENGRTSPGVNRFFDLPFIGFTARGNPDNGRLGTDRPHVFNAYGAYLFDWRGSRTNSTDIGFYTTVQSGTPQSTLVSFIVPIFLNERGDLGRTERFTQTDMNLSHKYKFGRDNRFMVAGDLNISNLFDEANVTGLFSTRSAVSVGPGTFGLSEVAGANAFTSGALRDRIITNLAGTSECTAINTVTGNPVPAVGTCLNRTDGRFGQPNAYQGPRSVRFGLRFVF